MESISAQRRERERTRLRESIVEAAAQILERDGYEAISIRGVAEAIEYAPATLYVHFADKESILGELGRRGFERLADKMRQIGHEDSTERLVQLGRAYLQFAVEHPRLYELMFIAKGLRFFDPESPEMATGPECFRILAAAITRLRETGRVESDVSDAILTYSVWGTVHGVASFAVSERFFWLPTDQVPQLLDTVCRTAVTGLLS